MRGLVILLLCAAAVLETAAGEYDKGPRRRIYSRPYKGPARYEDPYFRHNSGYGRRSHGPEYGYESEYKPDTKKPRDEFDILEKRIHGLRDKIKFLSENADALGATLSQQERRLNHLLNIVLPGLKQSIITLNDTFSTVEANLAEVLSEVTSATMDLEQLRDLNDENTADGELAADLLAKQVTIDVQHDRDIHYLLSLANNLKHKLIQILDNGLTLLHVWLKRDETRLTSVRDRERHRKCETGHVSLKDEDPRAEYLFQTEFPGKPQFDYGISGFEFDLETMKDSKGSPYDTRSFKKRTETLGVVVWAYSSPTGLTLQAFDESLGEASMKRVDAAFWVCSIGPGTIFHNYYYYYYSS